MYTLMSPIEIHANFWALIKKKSESFETRKHKNVLKIFEGRA